ncbi:hypothetical protein [Edaphovirga cremea]|uniref:hypothetical protein n=1 Tax=Edaphovirga cremea TaxID=2267246 RepID=UPI003988FC5A
MTFDEMVAEVISITKRPDLVDRIRSNIRAATLKAHNSDFYYRDIYEVPVQFTAPFYIQSFIPTEIVPKYRAAKYVRLWNTTDTNVNSTDGGLGKFLTNIQLENSEDQYGYIKNDVFYLAGQAVQIRSSCPLNKILFGCYIFPTILPEASYSSWIATDMPYVIIYEAARVTFKSISYTEQANEYSQLVGELYSELKMSYVDCVPLT